MPMRTTPRTEFSQMRICLLMALAVTACSTKDNPGPDCPLPTTTETISYAGTGPKDGNSISALLGIYCRGCHQASAHDRAGAPLEVNFDTYEETVSYGIAAVEQMANGLMPPPPATMPQNLVCRFDNWVQQNYPQ